MSKGDGWASWGDTIRLCPQCRRAFPSKKAQKRHTATHEAKGTPMDPNVATVDWSKTPRYSDEENAAAAESMVWTCGQYGHAKHPDSDGCICGEPAA